MAIKLTEVRKRDLVEQAALTLIHCGVTVEEALADFHRALLEAALERAGYSQMEAAKQQAMPRNTLRNQMIACGLLRRPRIQATHPDGDDSPFRKEDL